MKIIAEITPVPLARTKINTTNKGRFTSSKCQQFKRDLGLIAKTAMKGKEIFSGALSVRINLYKNCAITSRNYGDADNHAKAILDACNRIIWLDDSQIVNLQVVKNKGEGKIILEVIEVEKIGNAG